MKLELGKRTREIQRDWYGKRGISLHGFYVVAQVEVGERSAEVMTQSKTLGSPKVLLTLASVGLTVHSLDFGCICFLVSS